MNILLLNINIGTDWAWGGIESHSATLGAELAARGNKVIMGCWSEGAVTVNGDVMLPARRIRVRNSGDLIAIGRIMQVCRKEDLHVIISNCGREYWPATAAARLLGITSVIVRHQLDPIRWTTRRLINSEVSMVVAVSAAIRAVLLRSGINSDRITVIPNSIPTKVFNPNSVDRAEARKELGFANVDVVLGTVGKLHPGKGVYELVRAVGILRVSHPNLRLLFVGDGAELAGLQAEVVRLSLESRVLFAGRRKDIRRMYAAMDLFALPSHNEGLPTVVLEAMAMGKPVIATPVGGVPEIIDAGVNGVIVPVANEKALAQAISELVGNATAAASMAEQGRAAVAAEHSETVMADRFEGLLRQLIEPPSHN